MIRSIHSRPFNFLVIPLFTLLWFNALASATHAQGPGEYAPGEVVVKLAPGAVIQDVAANYGLDPSPLDQFGSRPIYRMRILNPAVLPSQRAEELESDPQHRVIYAEPNYLAQPPEGIGSTWADGGSSGGYADQWFTNTIRLPEALNATRGGGVRIAVLDTGVDRTHPALAGRLLGGFDFVDSDSDPNEVGSHSQNPLFGHGTHVAGLVALAAPDAQIIPVRVLDPNGVGNIWVLSEGLAYAVNPDGNPNTNDGAHVINLSLGTKRQTDLLAEIVAAVTCRGNDNDNDDDEDCEDGSCATASGCLAGRQGGAVVIASAGNTGDRSQIYPAAEGIAGSLAVGASTESDTLALFSTRGPWVRVLAPGERILSSVPGGRYGVWSGTSMAAPLAAGEAALVLAKNQGMSSAEVVERIVATAKTINSPVPRRIDTAAAVGLRRP